MRALAAGLLVGVLSNVAFAQAYPTKPIRVVVPNPAGGIDVYARVFLPRAVELLGQPIVIENRAGASGAIGAENIAKSPPDGYSLLFSTSAQIVTSPFLNKSLPYDPIRDFTPVTKALEPVEALLIHAALPFNSVRELIDYAKKNPVKLSYGSSGVGSIPHFEGELFKAAAGVDMLHVPYKGLAQILPELAAGRIDVAFPGIGSGNNIVATGKARILAVMDETRYAGLPDMPSITETLPGFRRAPLWFSFFGPAKLPAPIVDRLHAAFVKSLGAPEVREQLAKMYLRPVGGTPDELAASIRSDMERTAALVKSIGLKPE